MLIEQRRDQIMQANNITAENGPQYDWFVGIYDDICNLIKQYGPTML